MAESILFIGGVKDGERLLVPGPPRPQYDVPVMNAHRPYWLADDRDKPPTFRIEHYNLHQIANADGCVLFYVVEGMSFLDAVRRLILGYRPTQEAKPDHVIPR